MYKSIEFKLIFKLRSLKLFFKKCVNYFPFSVSLRIPQFTLGQSSHSCSGKFEMGFLCLFKTSSDKQESQNQGSVEELEYDEIIDSCSFKP